ncbi:glycoside hydrolase family 130 protein [Niveispirillum fermenti]|uniref:glycoside hydrolase family 130 protein n=1 Tax=Niveispirillum fermenti TaxID=1233113 RepID=UPI003A8C3D82
MSTIPSLTRQPLQLRPDPSRVVVRPFKPATEPRDLNSKDKSRANRITERVLSLDPDTTVSQLADVLENFRGRHRQLLEIFEQRADEMEEALDDHEAFTPAQRQLLGAYFLHEYSFEASALFNPSIVRHPDQSGIIEGGLRFILSLRAVGEGHISSLTFLTGVICPDGRILMDPKSQLASIPRVANRRPGPDGDEVEIIFRPEDDISERVIFPVTDSQANGIEDARFVEFTDGRHKTYYATYTAYSGHSIRTELIETSTFDRFRMMPMRGPAVRNKGMALFPRRVNGRYAMIGRQDNENLYLIYSDDLQNWEDGTPIMRPAQPWEFVQIGNCGPPIETDEGWLLLTHGVGPVRRYSIGAVLLHKDDPSKVIGRLTEPLLRPEQSERAGYVPNVVYTCGALVHGKRLVVPYGIADTITGFATLDLDELFAAMRT